MAEPQTLIKLLEDALGDLEKYSVENDDILTDEISFVKYQLIIWKEKLKNE